MRKFLGLALITAGAILISGGAICCAILGGATEAYPLLIIGGIVSFVVGTICLCLPEKLK